MEDKIKQYLGYLPYLLPIVYLFGFIVINSYLIKYGHSDYTAVNFSYLRAGILFSILFSLNFYSASNIVDLKTESDSYIMWRKRIIHTLIYTLLGTLVMIILVVDKSFLFKPIVIILNILTITIGLVGYIYIKIFPSPKKSFIWQLMVLFSSLGIVLIHIINNQITLFILIFNMISILISIALLQLILTNKIHYYFIVSGYLIILCAFFGNKIYGLWPTTFGGPKQYQIVVDNDCLTNNDTCKSDTLKVIYENDNYFIFDKDSTTFVVSREEIKCYYVVK